MNPIELVSQAFTAHVVAQYSLTPEQSAGIIVTLNTDESKKDFGDLSSQVALALAKVLGKAPRAIAQELAAFKHELVERIEIAGPGFLNFFLTRHALGQLAGQLLTQKEKFFKPEQLKTEKINIEFVSANPTGPLHLGHGRGGIIGDVLGNVLRFLGHQVTKEYYINDAGSQLQKLGHSLKVRCQQLVGHEATLAEDGYQGEYLIELAKECVKTFGTEVVSKPEEFFSEYGKEQLLAQIKTTLSHYGIHFDVWFSERSLHTDGSVEKELTKLMEAGHLYEKEGALWFKSTEFGDDKDRVLRKANGELTYVASDIGYLENKMERGFDQLIMILGQDHHSYVVRLKGLAQAMGYNPDRLTIILYQLVTLKASGAVLRMSKRTGTMVTLQDILDTVGTDVARFFYLNRKADAHLDFDVDLALKKTEENPVYYLQYAYVRTRSIMAKAQEAGLSYSPEDCANITTEEAIILKKIAALKDLLFNISKNHQTHLLTYYLLELAHTYHAYYSAHRIIDMENVPQSRARLLVTSLVQDTVGMVLELLGVSRPEKM